MAQQTETRGHGSAGGDRGPALAILATAPRPGLVLTGACPPLRPAEAAGLQTAWLKHLVQELPGVAVVLCGRPADALPMLRYFAGPGVELQPWPEPGHGPVGLDALQRAAAALLDGVQAPVLVRTADTPDVAAATVLACLDAARDGHAVLGRDQRGAAWLLAAPDRAALARTPRRGPWARSVQHGDDLALLLQERLGPDRAEPLTLPVRDLQAALRFYECVFATELLATDGQTATLAGPAFRLRLAARGTSFHPNGLRLPVRDCRALAAALAPHRVVLAGDEPDAGRGAGNAFTATDACGNRLTFVDDHAAP
jgi:glycosyltransferase A (GT-A) superfamily protein (DUF2064 family)/catechol 2,3-dioxygenase-like lactoylglutathione lyase family enzyme